LEGIRHLPPAPDKELPFLVFNLLHFPSDDAAKEYEQEVANWWPELHVFVGRVTGGGPECPIPGNPVSEKFTHIIVWRYKDFDEYRRQREDYVSTLEHSSKPMGDWPGYLQDVGWGFYAVDQRDPVLGEGGVEEWDRRLVAQAFAAAEAPDPERAAAARKIAYQALGRDSE
jgi:hypothetical protein